MHIVRFINPEGREEVKVTEDATFHDVIEVLCKKFGLVSLRKSDTTSVLITKA